MFNFVEEVKDPMFLFWKTQICTIKSINGHMIDFKKYLMNNKFIGENVRNESIKCVDEVLRRAFLSYKYVKLWLEHCIKRKVVINDFDLELNEINENKKDVIVYLDLRERRKYLFSQKDFKKLIITNLEHSYIFDHMPQPLPIKNPYTNREFNKFELIDIDNMLVDSPLIWKLYRDCKYNLERFKIVNYNYLLISSVGSYVDQLEKEDLVFYIEDIFIYYNYTQYCKKCVSYTNNLRNRNLRDILMNWFLFQKKLGIFKQSDLNVLCDMFKINCEKHNKKKSTTKFKTDIINIEFTGGPIKEDFVFTAGSNNSNETNVKQIVKNKKKNKNVLKKKVVIKTIS